MMKGEVHSEKEKNSSINATANDVNFDFSWCKE